MWNCDIRANFFHFAVVLYGINILVEEASSLEVIPAEAEEFTVSTLQKHAAKQHLKILVVGKRGIGKHTLVTELFGEGEECSNNSRVPASATLCDNFNIDGVSIQVWILDSLELNGHLLKELDLVIFATRMDDSHYRIDDQDILQALSREYGVSVWRKGMVVLTFANRVTYVDPDTGKEQQSKEHLMKKARDWVDIVRRALRDEGVNQAVLEHIPTVPVGHPSKVQLYDNTESWKTALIQCMIVRLRASGMEASVAMWRVMKDNIQLHRDQSALSCEW